MKTIATFSILMIMSMIQTSDEAESVHDFKMENIDGEEIPLAKYQGKVLLIVNVASKCGFTPQYEGLEAIYEKYHDKGFEILGFPANNFGGQEPGTNDQIKQFCKLQYGVKFPMFSKISVKGDDIDSLFKYLTEQKNPGFTGDIKWNFEKFLINKDGKLLHRFRSAVTPQSEELTKAIDNALNG